MPMHEDLHASRRRPLEAGFTLVEIMVVVVILGLLATLVATNVIGASDTAREQKARTDIKMISGGVQRYYATNGRLPETLETLWTKDERGRSELEEVDNDPWGNPYKLIPGDTPRDFEVISLGPDGSEGSDDDISSKTKKDE